MKRKKNNLFKKGLSVDLIKWISKKKNEPKWMLTIRLKAYYSFLKLKNHEKINFKNYVYYHHESNEIANKWNNVPNNVKNIFQKLKVVENEKKFMLGLNSQCDFETIYSNLQKDLKDKGIIFCNLESALKICPEIVKKYFCKLINFDENKSIALNTAVWSGGTFIYIPQNIVLTKPLQSYFTINTKNIGQFERTLIIVENYASLSYIEGCATTFFTKNNLHMSVSEIFIKDHAHFKHISIQNWPNNLLNLVAKKSSVGKNSTIEWIDGNIGAKLNTKSVCTILQGDNSKIKCTSIAIAKKNAIHNINTKIIHHGSKTKAEISTKAIVTNGGKSNHQSIIEIKKKANNSLAKINCDSLILDDISLAKTTPIETICNQSSSIKHETKITNIDKEKLFYLCNKGLDNKQAKKLISLGFLQTFKDQLPMEYAVEINHLIKDNIK